jgi:hypothetical protein
MPLYTRCPVFSSLLVSYAVAVVAMGCCSVSMCGVGVGFMCVTGICAMVDPDTPNIPNTERQ